MTINKSLYNLIWYGSWLLIGITIGLIIYPNTSHAAVIFDNITIPPTGAYSQVDIYTDQTYFNTTDTYHCIVGYAETNMYIDSITVSIAPDVSSLYGNEVGMWIYKLGSATSTLVGAQLSTGTFSNNLVTLSSLTTSFSTSTFTFGSYQIDAGDYFCISFYDVTETTVSGTNAIQVRTNNNATSTGFVFVAPEGTSNGARLTAYDDLNDISAYGSVVNLHKMMVTVEGGTWQGPVQVDQNPSRFGSYNGYVYITNVYPAAGSYDIGTTSYYIALDVTMPAEYYNKSVVSGTFQATLECSYFPRDSNSSNVWQSDINVIKEFTCIDPTDCTVEFENLTIYDEKAYECLYGVELDPGFWWSGIPQADYAAKWFTFASTNTPSAVEYWQNVEDDIARRNAATSTDPFYDCRISTLDLSGCMLALLVPNEFQMTQIQRDMHNAVFQKFPFNLTNSILSKGQTLYPEDPTTIGTTTLSDISFEIEDMHGSTTTVTIFIGSEFIQHWEDDFFAPIRNIIETVMYLMFLFYLFFRIRRLIPTPDSLKYV